MDGRLINRLLGLGAIASLLCVVLQSGCVGRGNTEVLESQLRLQHEQLAEARRQKQQLEGRVTALERERDLLAARPAANILPEQARAASAVESIEVQRLLSGRVDADGGGNAVKLVVQPVDADGEVVRAVGEFHVKAIRASSKAESRSIELVAHQESNLGAWKFSNRETDDSWRTGFGRGYHLRLPMHPEAMTVPLEFSVRFKTIDGREFETSTTISPTT